MSAEPKTFVSLIVPVYNKLPHLRNCLLSLKHQSCPPDELVVSDDGSEDDIVTFLETYKDNGGDDPLDVRTM